MSLFDVLRELDQRGDLLRDRPESMWCRQYEEILDEWERMGGVPADLSTVEALAQIALTLWRRHKSLLAVLDEISEREGEQ